MGYHKQMRTEKKIILQEKGWSDKEILHAEKSLERGEKSDLFLSKIVFWSALVVIIFANLLVSLVLIPFLIFISNWSLYLITVVLAATVGFLYNLLIMDIGHLGRKHHVLAGIFVPLLAILNVVIMVLVSNKFILALQQEPSFGVNSVHNPVVVAGIFAIAFILPYLFDKMIRKE